MAPELCLKEEYDGPAVDIWAAGVVLYTLLLGSQPWKGKTEEDLFKKICKGTLTFPKPLESRGTTKNLDRAPLEQSFGKKTLSNRNLALNFTHKTNDLENDFDYVVHYSKASKKLIQAILQIDRYNRPTAD